MHTNFLLILIVLIVSSICCFSTYAVCKLEQRYLNKCLLKELDNDLMQVKKYKKELMKNYALLFVVLNLVRTFPNTILNIMMIINVALLLVNKPLTMRKLRNSKRDN